MTRKTYSDNGTTIVVRSDEADLLVKRECGRGYYLNKNTILDGRSDHLLRMVTSPVVIQEIKNDLESGDLFVTISGVW